MKEMRKVASELRTEQDQDSFDIRVALSVGKKYSPMLDSPGENKAICPQ